MIVISEPNKTFWQNDSHEANETLEEFPEWRLTFSLVMLGFWLISVPLTTLLSSSVLIAVNKSLVNKELAIVHMYVLVLNSSIRIATAMTNSSFVSSVFRFCSCSEVGSSITFLLYLFNVSYQPYIFTSIAVLQLLILKGKRRLVNRKNVGITLTVVTAIAIAVPLIFIVAVISQDGMSPLCSGGCAGLDTSRLVGIFASFYGFVWLPSSAVVVTITIWSCVIFKKNYAGGNGELNRRIIAMPLVIPFTITLTTIASFGLFRVIDLVSTLPAVSSTAFVDNWIAFFRYFVALLNEISIGLSYPCMILFQNPKLWSSWKMLYLSRNGCFAIILKHNQVSPEQSNTSSIAAAQSSSTQTN